MNAATASGMRRLAYVVNALNPGGTEKLVVEMSLAFARKYSLLVVCLDDVGAWGRQLRSHGIEVVCVYRQPGQDLSMPRKLAKLFREHDIDLVHAHQCTPWFYSALARLFYSKPKLLLEEHGRFYPEVPNRPRAFVNRMLIRRLTHRFVAVSADVRTRLERYEGLDAAQIEVIYNGVPPAAPHDAQARRSLRHSLGLADEDFIVGTVGRFDSIKNLPMLIDAIAAARARVPLVRGLLVGDGPQMPLVRRLLEERGLAEAVKLTGYRDDARLLARSMDLFVLSSFSEGTSMALLEAMAAGTAVAVTRVGGNPELVENGVTGWVMESGDAAGLADAILEAATTPAERARRAEAGRLRFKEKFEIDRMLARYDACYEELLAASPPRAALGRAV